MVLGLAAMPIGAVQAQLCFDVFFGNGPSNRPNLACADADFFIDDSAPGFNPDSFTGHDTGIFEADFDGLDIFGTDPVPGAIQTPFFSSVKVTPMTNGSQTSSFDVVHRGAAGLAPAESEFQSVAYQTRSRITFIPVHLENPLADIVIDLDINFGFTLGDPEENTTSGAALAGFGVKVEIGDPDQNPEFDISALAELDLDPVDDDLEFFGLDDPELSDETVGVTSVPADPDEDIFDVEIDLEIDIGDVGDDIDEKIKSGDRVTIEIDTFGSIFSDGFVPGDTAAWMVDSSNTFGLVIASPDPNVIFIIIPEPSSTALVLFSIASLILRRRRR